VPPGEFVLSWQRSRSLPEEDVPVAPEAEELVAVGYTATRTPYRVWEVDDLGRSLSVLGDETLDVVLQPQGDGRLEGTLHGPGEISRLVAVSLRSASASVPSRGVLAEQGAFLVEDLEPGRWSISIECLLADGTRVRGAAEIDVPASGTARVEIELEPED